MSSIDQNNQTQSQGRSQQEIERFESGSMAFGMTFYQLTTVFIAIIVTGVISFFGGILYSRQQDAAFSEEFTAFWQAWNIIEDDYYRTPPNEQDRVYAAIEGLTNSLEDPFSGFSRPVQADENREFLSGVFGGIGATVQDTEDGRVVIVQVIAGNPAEAAGLLAGDIIIAVDGDSTEGLDVGQTVELIRGEVGTDVNVTVYRPDEDEEITFTIERDLIQRPVVITQMIDDIGYIYLADFSAVATEQLEREIRNVLNNNPRAVVFDMRGNGGGFLDQALSIADIFLDDGLVMIERDRDGEVERYFSQDGGSGEGIPLVVLIDGGTASASEIVAGAIQDRSRGIIVGQRSFGKTTVQEVNELSGGAELRITVAGWFTPQEQDINGVGLEPDILIEGDQFDDEGNDLILDAALEYIDVHYPAEDDNVTAKQIPIDG